MLPRTFRLPAAIRLTQPSTYVTPYFIVKVAANGLQQNRYGFVIGKAVAKEAVHRNRARRVLRSCIEERLESIKEGHDMLFLLKKGIIAAERETLLNEIDKFLKVKHLLKS